MTQTNKTRFIALIAILITCSVVSADQVILDDMVIIGSTCIGVDCVNGEVFAFETLRFKENNLRIRFQDTSNSASFPSNDWQITINDSTNGGSNYFAVEDIDGGQAPFKIDAGAAGDSLHVGANGNVGFGTSMPGQSMHAASDDTPGLRLEQNGMGGFTPQTWDISGNEANFFVRDVTGGGELPFRIRPGAPTGSLDIVSDGSVGIGTSIPEGLLHVYREETAGLDPNVDAALLIETNRVTEEPSLGVVAKNNGATINAFIDKASGKTWYVEAGPDGYEISEGDGSVTTMMLEAGGDVTIKGTFNDGSSRSTKHNITNVDGPALLEAVVKLPIKNWQYIADPDQARHIGPMAEDFYASFSVGADNKHLASLDTAGVALASIQALNAKLEKQNQDLRSQNDDLQKRLQAIESIVTKLAAKNR